MALHFVSARRLAAELAEGKVAPQEQALYLAASFVLWALPTYLFIVPPHVANAWAFPLGLWFYEAFALVAIYLLGVFYCLQRCHVEPRRNFLVDFSCLNAPISLTTLVIGWGVFYVYAGLGPWLLHGLTFDLKSPFLEFIYSARSFDLVRYAVVVGMAFAVFIRTGNWMKRISRHRLSANHTVDADAPVIARGSP